MTCEHDQQQYGAIREGACPRCLQALQSHGDHGRCACCEGCYAAGPGEMRLVLHPRNPFTGEVHRLALPFEEPTR